LVAIEVLEMQFDSVVYFFDDAESAGTFWDARDGLIASVSAWLSTTTLCIWRITISIRTPRENRRRLTDAQEVLGEITAQIHQPLVRVRLALSPKGRQVLP
jgi:uncharacterized membrane protein YccC